MSNGDLKYVTVVRHAKSSWKETYLQDHDRRLNKRGLRDAPIMAAHFKKEINQSPDLILSSSARRTKDTSIYFKEMFDVRNEDYLIARELYHASSRNIQELISKQSADFNSIMLFVHNPGITDFVNELAGAEIDNIPTCGVAVISFDISEWKEIETVKGSLKQYFYPKGI